MADPTLFLFDGDGMRTPESTDHIDGGFYLKARKVQGSWIAKAPPHVREIWDFILLKANYKDCGDVKRGQLLTTYRDIQEGLAWFVGYRKETYKKHHCEIAMKALTRERMIATAKTTRGLVITVLNYDKYQNPKNYENDGENDNETTMKLQPTDTIRKEREEREKGNRDSDGAEAPVASPDCPHEQIISIYHEALPQSPRVKRWGEPSRKMLRARWNEDRQRQALEWWKEFFAGVATSDFLTGRVNGSKAEPFVASLNWLLKPMNMEKVLNGNYGVGSIGVVSGDRSCATCQHHTNPLCQAKADVERQACTGWRSR